MKYKKRVSFLNGILNLILVLITLFIIGMTFFMITAENLQVRDKILQTLILLVLYIGYFMMSLTLKRILKSVKKEDPFNRCNVNYLKRIGYYILIVGIIDAIISYPRPNIYNLQIMATSYGSLKPISLLYLILSILSFILSDVFRMAVEIKEDNDLTV